MKIRTYRTFWILFIGFILLFPTTFYFAASKFMDRPASEQEQFLKNFLGNPFSFPRVWLSSSYFGGMFFVILGMLFILLITNEVQYRTHRQNIIDGWSRFDFLKAKFSVLIFLVLSATVLVFICGLWIGMLYTPADTVSMMDGLYYVGYFVLMATMYLMVAYVVAILVKRTGLSIIIYFAFVFIVDNLFWLVFTMQNNQVGYFAPLESTDSLVPNPFKPSIMEKRSLSDTTLIIIACSYLALFGFLIKNYFQKIDLKT